MPKLVAVQNSKILDLPHKRLPRSRRKQANNANPAGIVQLGKSTSFTGRLHYIARENPSFVLNYS